MSKIHVMRGPAPNAPAHERDPQDGNGTLAALGIAAKNEETARIIVNPAEITHIRVATTPGATSAAGAAS